TGRHGRALCRPVGAPGLSPDADPGLTAWATTSAPLRGSPEHLDRATSPPSPSQMPPVGGRRGGRSTGPVRYSSGPPTAHGVVSQPVPPDNHSRRLILSRVRPCPPGCAVPPVAFAKIGRASCRERV